MNSFSLLKSWHRTIPSHHVATHDGSDPEDDDDGPFFDLEFDVSEDDEGKGLYRVGNASASEGQDGNDDTYRGCLDNECSDLNDSSVCTSDDDCIFFKGDILHISPSTDEATMPKTDHLPVSLMKSSARLRVLIKKHVSSQENPGNGKTESEPRQNIRRLFIKFKVEEKPLVSLYAIDNTKPSLAKKVTGIRAGLRVVCRLLGKSRSGSFSVTTAPGASAVASRRDDSLLQQQDGIQGAILHCKRSFNESRDLDLAGFPRSASDPSHKKLMESEGRE